MSRYSLLALVALVALVVVAIAHCRRGPSSLATGPAEDGLGPSDVS